MGKVRVTNQTGQYRSTHVNVRIKVIIMVLKPNLEVDLGMAQVMGQKVQHGMTRVNA